MRTVEERAASRAEEIKARRRRTQRRYRTSPKGRAARKLIQRRWRAKATPESKAAINRARQLRRATPEGKAAHALAQRRWRAKVKIKAAAQADPELMALLGESS